MPYATLPNRLKQMMPDPEAQKIFMRTFNSQQKSGKSESVAYATAWAAIDRAGYKKDAKSGIYTKKSAPTADAVHVPGSDWKKKPKKKPEETKKRQVLADAFTLPNEARERSMQLGLGGEIHVYDNGDQGLYMPGLTHDDFLAKLQDLGGIASLSVADDVEEIDDEENPESRGLLDQTISAIIGAIMQHAVVNKSSSEAKILKVDTEQRIVWGWASVVTEKGKTLIDTQGDVISPSEMEKMANDFMLDVRTAKAMHDGGSIGEVIHSLPLTNELGKALGVTCDREGWIIAMKIHDDDVWDAAKKGQFSGFSIGGRAGGRKEISDAV